MGPATWGDLSHGVYMDNSSFGATIKDNTISNCRGYGIYLHDAKDKVVSRNVSFNNQVQFLARYRGTSPMINNIVSGNTFYCTKSSQKSVQLWYSAGGWDNSRITLSGNGYYNPRYLKNIEVTGFGSLTLQELQEKTGQDATGKELPWMFNYYENVKTIGSDILVNGTFNNDAAYPWVWGGRWDNTQLDLGCIRFDINADGANVNVGQGIKNVPIDNDTLYRVAYDVIAPNSVNRLNVMFDNAPWPNAYQSSVADNKRRHYEHFFTTSEDVNSATFRIRTYGNEGNSVFYDNISFYKVQATPVDPLEKSKLFYNDTKSVKTFTLSGTYNDLDGATVTGSITLQPFTSQIFIRAGKEKTQQAPLNR
jgi:parallel beta-helix repeat protein